MNLEEEGWGQDAVSWLEMIRTSAPGCWEWQEGRVVSVDKNLVPDCWKDDGEVGRFQVTPLQGISGLLPEAYISLGALFEKKHFKKELKIKTWHCKSTTIKFFFF